MRNFLFKVEQTFNIKGRGLVLITNIPEKTDLPKSAMISLVRPNGSILETEAIFGISFFSFSKVEDRKSYIPAYECILQNIGREEVPKGTEVWLN
jgi:translation elongation factor EF-Tu-like GTPase